jgi:hypothetical protein
VIKTRNNIQEIFEHFFAEYKNDSGKDSLTYVITSTDRPGNPKNNPHALPGNAMDLTLRTDGKYAHIKEYNELFKHIMFNWPFRAGIDNTWVGEKIGNVHIHIDLGENRPEGQELPYFFKENHGKFINQIIEVSQI